MFRYAILALSATALVAACSPLRQYHGYLPDESQPADIEPGEDTRSSVLARLGTPSTKSIFDDNTWFYMSTSYASFAYFKPKVSNRDITAIKFGEDDVVDEIVQYDADDGEVLSYSARKTATRGRELGLLEQIFGTAGTAGLRLPNTDDNNAPGQLPGQ